MQTTGTLYLIPSLLAEEVPLAHVFPANYSEILSNLQSYFVENERHARRFLGKFQLPISIQDLHFFPIGKHASEEVYQLGLSRLLAGEDMGVISEAGCPGVADPGQQLVSWSQASGVKIVPLVGPSSILLALMGSGLNGQSFAFVGYLPVEEASRTKRLKNLEQLSHRYQQTQIFIETPYRNNALLKSILKTCQPQTRLCIASNLTAGELEQIRTRTIGEWQSSPPDLHQQPTVFLLQG